MINMIRIALGGLCGAAGLLLFNAGMFDFVAALSVSRGDMVVWRNVVGWLLTSTLLFAAFLCLWPACPDRAVFFSRNGARRLGAVTVAVSLVLWITVEGVMILGNWAIEGEWNSQIRNLLYCMAGQLVLIGAVVVAVVLTRCPALEPPRG